MQLLFAIIAPWILFFVTAIFSILTLVTSTPKLPMTLQQAIMAILSAGTFLCLIANSASIRKAGIWLSEALPEALRYGTGHWIFLALKSAVIAAAIYGIGLLPWTPLIWQGVILPAGMSICLFVFLWLLYGTILRWSVNVPWSRAFALIVSFPLMLLVPLTAFYLQKQILFAYRASQADPAIALDESAGALTLKPLALGASKPAPATDVKEKDEDATTEEPLSPEKTESLLESGKASDRVQGFKSLATIKGGLCAGHAKEITKALDPRGDSQVVLWAVKAAKCADLKSVIALPRFVQIMNEHKNPETRAAAIRALRYYGNEHAKEVAYLLPKRLADHEPPEVIDATAEVLAQIGGEQQHFGTNRLKALLDSDKSSEQAGHALMKYYHRADLVADYVKAHLPEEGAGRKRAISMICSLPNDARASAEPYLPNIVATIKTADKDDQSLAALRCLGPAGVKAIRDELRQPKHLDRSVAAHAFAEVDVDKSPETIDTASDCVRDPNFEVRKWCGQSLGHLGSKALPKIMELLNSSDPALKSSGQNALLHLDDPTAEPDLQKILQANTGWMATPRKLQVAKLVGTALNRIKKGTD